MLKVPADTDANILVVPDPKPAANLAIHFEHRLVSHEYQAQEVATSSLASSLDRCPGGFVAVGWEVVWPGDHWRHDLLALDAKCELDVVWRWTEFEYLRGQVRRLVEADRGVPAFFGDASG